MLQQSGTRLKDLTRKYGKVALGVHLAVYFTTLAGLYIAVEKKVDVQQILTKYGLISKEKWEAQHGSGEEDASWLQRVLNSGGSSLVLAFIANKALLPVRLPVTIALTPMVARALRGPAQKATLVNLQKAAQESPPQA